MKIMGFKGECEQGTTKVKHLGNHNQEWNIRNCRVYYKVTL